MTKLGFGELELSIFKIIRKLGRGTVRDVYEGLGSPGSYTTVMTVMSRMAEKGELMREKEGKQYVYWIVSQNESSSKSILKRIQDKIFGGKSTAMVSYLLEADGEISDKDLEEIEKIVRKRRLEKKHG
ncbi:MAG: BlaI/MecI/CopY family transcriptional regulator [Parachlamydiaceae bacterium]